MLPLRRYFSVKSSASAISPRILVTGASGQLGMGMIKLLQKQYGQDSVVASDIRPPPTVSHNNPLNFKYLNVLDKSQLSAMVVNERINWLIHFSAILSYKGEQNPDHAFKVNIEGVQNVLEVSKDYALKVFVPSTIGVYGKESPKDGVQDVDIQRPNTVYGITKVYAELIGQYYYEKFGVEFRSLRYPGVLSGDSQPGGGTTDYAVEIFHSIFDNLKVHSNGNTMESVYECPLGNDQMLPMMHIDDCLNATLQILATERLSTGEDNSDLRVFNVSGLSFTPKELEHGIQKFLKDKLFVNPNGDKFSIQFQVDYSRVDPVRSSIAASWPHSLDDSRARTVWGYEPSVKSIDSLVAIMINQISALKGFSIMKHNKA